MKATIYLSLFLIGLQLHYYHFTGPHVVQSSYPNIQQQQSTLDQECNTGDNVWHKIIPYNADFAFRLYKEMSSTIEDKNILFSPISVSSALAMLSLGAKSETQSQIYDGLAFNLSEIEQNEIHKGFCQLMYRHTVRAYVKTGNALFLDKSLEVLPTFLEDVRHLYHAEDFSIDFLNNTGAKHHINDYVKNKTEGTKINTVKYLSKNTRMVLVNYFLYKGEWEERFIPELTLEEDFFAYGNTTVKLNMMLNTALYKFVRDEELFCSVVEVPFSGVAVALFILPDQGKLKDLESSLVKEDLDKWRTSFQYKDIKLSIPKFSAYPSYDVKRFLQRLGMRNAFNQHADFSKIAAKHNLRISQVLHEVMLVVNEEGGVVAGAMGPSFTFFADDPIFLLPTLPPPLVMTFNRPFLMFVIDSSTGTILLMGKIVIPN
ncbi:corticosteroid-binding globulin-like [Sphaerodactylus townsendi]|uniref:corticosteroid-binding globulin-like n=1 Tax=Sphaerodactylus townsendi TaxID=933632 RepID=UPI002027304A|nr:corticosteroid-binding globulin-like [Sphaerodactylus townsendi]